MAGGARAIDLNADVGESFGAYRIGEDEALIPLVTSVNVACGFHAGDPLVIERTIRRAVEAGAAVGAHPGYPDLAGFGRRALSMKPDELESAVLYQIAAVAGIARAVGTELRHVKAHGALYNRAARDPGVARPIARAVRRFSGELVFVGLAGSVMNEVARDEGLTVAEEAFADRGYRSDGTLVSRDEPGAILPGPAETAEQAVAIALDRRVRTVDGRWLELPADTLCLHGDSPRAADRASAVRAALAAAGVDVRAR
ncbi:MAG TPA: 5-oxoprolinase subunit PxpA [Candidatus Limnocylindrales bacterium]|nr:5-oxoprolinase subunit PxpA [Candidatus Limnocylindrales bacterium]